MNENRIMIVDDEVDILNLLEKALNIEGYYNITKVDNGLDAVSICKQIQPDVIILDIMLPGIDGYEWSGKNDFDANDLRRFEACLRQHLPEWKDHAGIGGTILCPFGLYAPGLWVLSGLYGPRVYALHGGGKGTCPKRGQKKNG